MCAIGYNTIFFYILEKEVQVGISDLKMNAFTKIDYLR